MAKEISVTDKVHVVLPITHFKGVCCSPPSSVKGDHPWFPVLPHLHPPSHPLLIIFLAFLVRKSVCIYYRCSPYESYSHRKFWCTNL